MMMTTDQARAKTAGFGLGQSKTAKTDIFRRLPVSGVEDEMFHKLNFVNVVEPRRREMQEVS